jgi:hypothetical protein
MDKNKTIERKDEQTIYVYTQHAPTIRVLEVCGKVVVLTQDRQKDPVDDVLSQIRTDEPAVLYAVLPLDKAIELRQGAPHLTLRLLQLDGTVVERLTGRPYDPKSEYPLDTVKAALKIIEVKSGKVKYYKDFKEMIDEIVNKGYRKIGVFNDTMREGMKIALQQTEIELVKTCSSNDCVQINPLGLQSGYRISLPGTAGRLTPEQIAEALVSGTARMYHVELTAEVVPLCERPES